MTGNAPLTLILSLPEGSPQGTVIRYTLDGSEPTLSSATYSAPITINSNRVVRAKLFVRAIFRPVHSPRAISSSLAN